MDLTRANYVDRFGVVPIVNAYPIAASTYLYAGNYVALNASGYLIQTSLTASTAYAIVGVVSKDYDNSTGAAGDLIADVENIYFLDNDSTNPITAAHLMRSYCFIVDNHTVSSADLGYRPLAGVPVALGSAANGTTGKVAVACAVATPFASNPYLAASSDAFTARNVATNIAALTFAADGTFEADANGALGAQDGVTNAAGDVIILPVGTITTGVVSAANSGPYVLTSIGGASAKFAGRRPAWWSDGANVPNKPIDVRSGTLFSVTQWKPFCAVSQVIGTDDPILRPLKVTQQVTLVAGTKTISNVPILSTSRSSAVTSGAVGGTPAGTTTNFAVSKTSGITAGGIGTAAVIIEAQSVAGTIVNTDVSVLNVTIFNG